jgi:RNA polymerase sigma-70 factor, ECF subfamily
MAGRRQHLDFFTRADRLVAGEDSQDRGHGSDMSAMRDLAARWVQSQPSISAYITANVFDLHEAEDLLQEVAEVAAEKFHTFDRTKSFTSWALGIARIRLLKYYRSQSRERQVLGELALTRLGEALEHVEAEAEDRREALKDCLELVDGRRREVLELRYSGNLKAQEIAVKCGMTANAVFVMLHNIRKALFECVQKKLALR